MQGHQVSDGKSLMRLGIGKHNATNFKSIHERMESKILACCGSTVQPHTDISRKQETLDEHIKKGLERCLERVCTLCSGISREA